ncbi:MAG: excisionase family DNA-binding protein [Rubrivivax sp.]|nr:excisionase family DNA-binding protein [Rubrivivax sp.]
MSPPASRDDEESEHTTTLEVARQLGLAVRSVQLMVDRGELEAWKTPGGHRRISRASVQRWLAGQRAAPARDARDARDAQPARPLPRGRGGSEERPRVLLIEDSIHFQNLIGLLVKKHLPQAELHIAGDGITGLAMVGELRPQLLLVDILLPGIDGATLITGLRSQPRFAQTRLIVVTSLAPAERAAYALALEGLPVVHKPDLVAELPRHLAACLAGAQPAAEAPAAPLP